MPEDAYYGVQTARAIRNFPISGRRPDIALVRAAVNVKKAAARANHQTGRLPDDLFEAIVQAADEVLGLAPDAATPEARALAGPPDRRLPGRPLPGRRRRQPQHEHQRGARQPGHRDPGRSAASAAAGAATTRVVSPNDHVNMAQSTNDVFPTAMRVATLDRIREAAAPRSTSWPPPSTNAPWRSTTSSSPGRTHMQDAVPIRLGQEFAAYALTVKRARGRILAAAERSAEQNIGATAVGTGLNAEPEYIAPVVRFLSEQTASSSGRPSTSSMPRSRWRRC